jgi:3-methyl-2-oxobutanoate hydroxymethyltransferase
MKDSGCHAVKLEGGQTMAPTVRRLVEVGIPVMGHIGLTPQSLHTMGGYKVQGKSLAAIEQLMRDATALDRAGIFSIVLEGIPREVAAMITAEVSAPTIGIGAGPECDGQVLVLHDVLNLTFAQPAKFVRQYGDAQALIKDAVTRFKEDVERGAYPSEEESYHLPKDTKAAFDGIAARKRAMR